MLTLRTASTGPGIISKSESLQNLPMGFRYLLLILAFWGLYLIVRHLLRQRKQQQLHTSSPKAVDPKAVDSVQCALCGLHLPREEALRNGNRHFCSQAHLEAWNADAPSD
jgi:uncharacterized protein